MRVCKGVPRSHIYRVLRTGEVRVNSRRVQATYRLNLGDRCAHSAAAEGRSGPKTRAAHFVPATGRPRGRGAAGDRQALRARRPRRQRGELRSDRAISRGKAAAEVPRSLRTGSTAILGPADSRQEALGPDRAARGPARGAGEEGILGPGQGKLAQRKATRRPAVEKIPDAVRRAARQRRPGGQGVADGFSGRSGNCATSRCFRPSC